MRRPNLVLRVASEVQLFDTVNLSIDPCWLMIAIDGAVSGSDAAGGKDAALV